ncbi:hypothetical protein N0B16_03750 [Chryseobacterium sp. GMJ5]|uniref:DUF6705 domain-containing protein n=1 Tax=Chryseobacterium gilvum TaxID=2976534 RepID=A0ABT2VU65_9FLAO|nr:DUF6705 family protein [Chryseobacterium gilvum]MCU7613542.1 hypothetical protein [Chryseobacterium gilvum]
MMKKFIILITLHSIFLSCAQIYPLNTYTDVPDNAYIKDINNELVPYEGTWSGVWDNKTIYISFKRIKKYQNYDPNNPYYEDLLVGKFKVLNSAGLILYDNTILPDDNTKIKGLRFITQPTVRYKLYYFDSDICGITGDIYINFVNTNFTQLNWKFVDTTDIIDSSCQYYDTNPFPQPLPTNIVLTKQ